MMDKKLKSELDEIKEAFEKELIFLTKHYNDNKKSSYIDRIKNNTFLLVNKTNEYGLVNDKEAESYINEIHYGLIDKYLTD